MLQIPHLCTVGLSSSQTRLISGPCKELTPGKPSPLTRTPSVHLCTLKQIPTVDLLTLFHKPQDPSATPDLPTAAADRTTLSHNPQHLPTLRPEAPRSGRSTAQGSVLNHGKVSATNPSPGITILQNISIVILQNLTLVIS